MLGEMHHAKSIAPQFQISPARFSEVRFEWGCIDLDDQPLTEAAEIDDAHADRRLSPKLQRVKALGSQPTPENSARRRLASAQCSSLGRERG